MSPTRTLGMRILGGVLPIWGLVALIPFSGCESPPRALNGSNAGTRGGACYGNRTCNEGLVCRSNVCTLEGADASAELDAMQASLDAVVSDSALGDAGAAGDAELVQDGGQFEKDAGLAAADAGVVDTLDAGNPVASGAVFGVVHLQGETDHHGIVVRIAGRTGMTASDGSFRIGAVPVGSHALEAEPPAPSGLSRILGTLRRADGAVLPPGLRVALQLAPRTNNSSRTVGVVVFEGQDTEVPTLELARPAPIRRYAISDATGGFVISDVPAGTYSGQYPEQPDTHIGFYTQPVGTFSIVASTYPLELDESSESPGEQIYSLGFQSWNGTPGLGSDTAVMLGRRLSAVAGTDAQLDPIVVYSLAYVSAGGLENGLDVDAPAGVTASSGLAEATLSVALGSGTTRYVDIGAPGGVLVTNEERMDALRSPPNAGYASTARLTFDPELPWALGRQAAGERVLVLQRSSGAVKLKSRLSGQGSGPGGELIDVSFLVLPAQGAAFHD